MKQILALYLLLSLPLLWGCPSKKENKPNPKTSNKTQSLVQKGKKVYEKICKSCHNISGPEGVGPNFKGMWGRKTTVISNINGKKVERTLTIDKDYIIKSIKNPNADVVKGKPAAMVVGKISKSEIEAVVEFIKSLK